SWPPPAIARQYPVANPTAEAEAWARPGPAARQASHPEGDPRRLPDPCDHRGVPASDRPCPCPVCPLAGKAIGPCPLCPLAGKATGPYRLAAGRRLVSPFRPWEWPSPAEVRQSARGFSRLG